MKFSTYFIIISITWFVVFFIIFLNIQTHKQFSLEIKELAKLIYWGQISLIALILGLFFKSSNK